VKYYRYALHERIGEYENIHNEIIKLSDSANIEAEEHRIAKENRGSNDDDYEESMGGYWFGDGVTEIPDFYEISKNHFDIIQRANRILNGHNNFS